MYIGIGFLIAGLLVIGFIPLVHGRAVRLTIRHLDALNPVSMTEIQAQKDQLRAEFAMSTRRLEMKVEQLKTRNASQLAELDKKNDAISRVKFELGEKAAALLALEAKEEELAQELETTAADRATKAGALEAAERALAAAQARLAQLRADYHGSLVAEQDQKLLAERAQVEALKEQSEAYRIEAQELRDRLSSSESQIQQLTGERTTAQNLEDAVLREHINKVAADIVRLTATLEGSDSPIASILDGRRDAAVPAEAQSSEPTVTTGSPRARRRRGKRGR
jgi:DNA repair exonuclease SbcCD ATPase subunit